MRVALARLALSLSLLAGAALDAAAQGQLRVYNWNDYVAPEALKRFEQETGIKVTYDTYDGNEILDAQLRAGRSGYDLVVPTASPFLATQLKANLYRPLDKAKFRNFKNLDPDIMARLAAYDPGNAHAIPWMWGTVGVGYNVEAVGWNRLRIIGLNDLHENYGQNLKDNLGAAFKIILAFGLETSSDGLTVYGI